MKQDTMIVEKKLWDDMRQTLSGISMPMVSHQQVQQLLNHVEQVSMQRTLAAQQQAAETTKRPANGAASPDPPDA